MKIKIITFIVFLTLFSCAETSKKVEKVEEKQSVFVEGESKPDSKSEDITYFEFKIDTLTNFKLLGFDVSDAYPIDSNKIVVGYDQKVNPDSEKDWGDKLLLLNNKNEILFTSKGVGDVYLFEPHFYKNKIIGKI